MPWLITYERKTYQGGHSVCLENEVTYDDPLIRLCTLRHEHPKRDYVLLAAVEVADGPHVKQILEEHRGQPSGNALDAVVRE